MRTSRGHRAPETDEELENQRRVAPPQDERSSIESAHPLVSLQRELGNQAVVGLLKGPAPLPVQREGEGSSTLSVKERRRFFESGPTENKTPKSETVAGLNDRIISFSDALKIFQDLQHHPKAIEQPPPEVTTEPEPQPSPVSDGPLTPEHEPEGVYDEYQGADEHYQQVPEGPVEEPEVGPVQGPELPDFESLGGGSFTPKDLGDDYISSERENLNKKQKGLAYAGWAPSSWRARYVKYLDDEERTSYELKLLKDKGSTLFFWRNQALDTSKMVRKTTLGGSGAGKMIFVMSVDGKLYVADEGAELDVGDTVTEGERWRFNHSSFVQGHPIAAAGEMWFANGMLKGISDESGHYKPQLEHMLQLLRNLKDHGISLAGVILQIRGKQMDAELALQQDTVTTAKKAIDKFDKNVTKVNDKFERKGTVNWQAFDKAIDSLKAAREHGDGLQLRPKARELLEPTKAVAEDIADTLSDNTDPVDVAPDVHSLSDATATINAVAEAMISAKATQAIGELENHMDDLSAKAEQAKQTDPDAKPSFDLTTPRALISTAVAELGARSKQDRDDSALDRLDEQQTELDEVRENIGEAAAALDRLQRGKGCARIMELYNDHADVFARLMTIATVRENMTIGKLVDLIEDDLLDDGTEPDPDIIEALDHLVPGEGTKFRDSRQWTT